MDSVHVDTYIAKTAHKNSVKNQWFSRKLYGMVPLTYKLGFCEYKNTMKNKKVISLLISVLILILSSYGWYIYTKSFGISRWNSFSLFLNDKSLDIIDIDRPERHGMLSAKSEINGLCLEGGYRRKFFPPWVSIFNFYIPQTVIKEDTLSFVVSNSTVHNFNLFLDEQKDDKWVRLPIQINTKKANIDTTVKEAFELKKNIASERTTIEPDIVIFNKVITTSKITTYRLDTVWEFDYHFIVYNHPISIPINDLEYGRYRVKAEFAELDTIWNEFDLVPKRNVEWNLNDQSFIDGNFLLIGITNKSNEDFYYMGDLKNALIGIHATIKNGMKPDSSFVILENYTDVPVEWSRFPNDEKLNLKILNPFTYILLKEDKSWEHLYFSENPERFIKEFHTLFGDEFYISFSMRTRSLRFSRYKDQILLSKKFKIKTEDVIEALKSMNP